MNPNSMCSEIDPQVTFSAGVRFEVNESVYYFLMSFSGSIHFVPRVMLGCSGRCKSSYGKRLQTI